MYFIQRKKNKLYLLLIVLSALCFSCAKENPVDKLIPYVRVDLRINPASPQFVPGPNGNGDLSIAGNWAYIDGGYRGILVYNVGFGEYKAYERTVPYKFPNDSDCRVEVDDTNFFADDPCSSSKYSLLDGTVYDGPAKLPLKQYSTQFDGIYLHIFN